MKGNPASNIYTKALAAHGGDLSYFFANVRDIFSQDDLTLVNFEGVLTNSTKVPGSKQGNDFLFRAPPEHVQALTEGSVEAVALENNHVMDFGQTGYDDTIAALDAAGVVHASEDSMGVFEADGVSIALLAYQTFNNAYERLNEEMPQKQANAEEFNQQYQRTMADKSLDEAQWRQLTAGYDAEEPDRLQKEVSDFDQRKSKAEGQCTTAQKAIAGREKPNMEQLEAAFEAAKAAWEKASAALEAAKHLHSDNAKVLKDLRDGREPLAKACKAANIAQHLSDVMAGTESGNRMNLETFVQRSYMEKILCDANRRFRHMSNGQFELKLINVEDAGEGRNKGLDLEVYSIVTGKTRSVNTLSGGESFMAALSLALGMADQIQAATAAIHLDVMFIDEGFGSLSDNARNEAVNILKEMAGKQRQIGIISHVSELKDEIENQLIVKKDDRGSHISWR